MNLRGASSLITAKPSSVFARGLLFIFSALHWRVVHRSIRRVLSAGLRIHRSSGRRADLHRVWTRGRSTLPWNKRCSDEQAQRIFLPSDSVVSVIRSSPDKSTSLPARCYFDFSLPRPGLFHTTVHTTGVQSIQYARLAGRRSLKRVLLVEVRYDTAFLQPSANSFGTLCVVKEDGEIEHLPPSRRPLDRPTGTRDQQANEHARPAS